MPKPTTYTCSVCHQTSADPTDVHPALPGRQMCQPCREVTSLQVTYAHAAAHVPYAAGDPDFIWGPRVNLIEGLLP